MVTAVYQPRLEDTAAVLRAAIEASGMPKTEVARRVGVSASSISMMMHAKSAVSAKWARKLGALLHIDPATIISPPRPREGPGARKSRKAGPAARAVALHAQRERAVAVEVIPPREEAVPVFGMEARADGTTAVWLRATLAHDRAVALFRVLLDLGLTTPEK